MTGIKHLAGIVLAVCLFVIFFPAKVSAQGEQGFALSLNQEEYHAGDKVELSLTYTAAQQNIGAFLVRVEFDPAAVRYVKTQNGTALAEGYIKTTEDGGTLLSVYTIKNENSPLKSGELFRYSFTAEAFTGEAAFHISVEQLVDTEGVLLAENIPLAAQGKIEEPAKSNCQILKLLPSAGELKPAFDPQVTEYQIDVPFTVKEMTFEAEVSSGATWKINRKTLGAGGSATEFRLVVTAEDSSQSKTYTVTVNRAVKEAVGGAVTENPKTPETEASGTAGTKTKTAKDTKHKEEITAESAQANEITAFAEEQAEERAGNSEKSINLPVTGNNKEMLSGEYGSTALVIEGGNYMPFLWGVCSAVLLGLLLYLISLHIKLMILQKEEKLQNMQKDKAEQNDTEGYVLKHGAVSEKEQE